MCTHKLYMVNPIIANDLCHKIGWRYCTCRFDQYWICQLAIKHILLKKTHLLWNDKSKGECM